MLLCNVCHRSLHDMSMGAVYGLLPIAIDEETKRITSVPADMKQAIHVYCFEKIEGYFARRANG